MILSRLALRNLLRHPWRTLVTVLGVALGIAAVLATLSLGENIRVNLRNMLQAASGEAALVVSPGVDGRAVFEYGPLLAGVLEQPGVAAAWPVLRQRAEPLRAEGVDSGGLAQVVDSGFQLSGWPLEHAASLPLELKEGRLPEPGSDGLAVTADFAGQRDWKLGDTVSFPTQFGTVSFTLTGLLSSASGYGTSNFGRVGAADITAVQDAWRLGGRASFLEVVLDDSRPAARVQEELQERLGAAWAVVPPQVIGEVATGLVDALGAGLKVLALTLLVLAAFLAYNTFAAGVVERVREYALLRTICLTGRQLGRLALLEALFLSLAGVVAGLLLGVVLSRVLTGFNAAMLGVSISETVVPAGPVAVAALAGIGVSLLAGWLPAREAARVPPLTALSSASPVPAPLPVRIGWLLIAVGVAAAVWPWRGPVSLLMAGVAALGLFTGVTIAAGSIFRPALRLLSPLLERLFGVPGRLGASMALRNVNRNGVALGIVMVGLALTIGVGSMTAGVNRTVADWVDTTVLGDLFVTGPVGFPGDFAERVRAGTEEVDVVSGVAFNAVRFQPAEGRARTVALVLVEPERFEPGQGIGSFQFYRGQGTKEGAWRTLEEGGILIASSIQERFGLKAGSVMSLRTSEGFRDFEVGGVIVDFTSGGEAVVAGRQLQPLFGGGSPDLYVLTVTAGADAAAVAEKLPALFPELHLDVTLNSEYREFIMDEARDVFSTTNLLLVLALLIAGLGVGNTLGLNLAGRQHEFAVLRTLGLSRGGLARLVTAEGIVVTLTGTVAGLAAGWLLSFVITAGASALSGFDLRPAFPWWLLLAGIAASPLVALVAAYFPARRAARLPPVRALKAEE